METGKWPPLTGVEEREWRGFNSSERDSWGFNYLMPLIWLIIGFLTRPSTISGPKGRLQQFLKPDKHLLLLLLETNLVGPT